MSKSNIVKIDKDLEEIIPMFLDNRHKDLTEIQEHLDSSNLKSIEVIAHKLAGNAGSYGFTDLGKIGADMEKACQETSTEKVRELFELYKNFMDDLVVEFE